MECILCCPDIPLWFECPPVPASAFPVLCGNCKSSILGCRPGSLSWNRIPILFPTLPTTSGNLLTSFCEKLEIKHAAVVTNPQTQRLHFKNDWCVWVVSDFFLTELDDFAQQWKQRSTQRSQAKGLLPFVGCCLSAPVPGGWGCGEMLNLPAQGTESSLRSSSVWAPLTPLSGFPLHKFILQDLNAEQVL